MATNLLIFMLVIQFKHLIIDWIWQPPYEYKNKGTYMHPGGLIHAIKNGAGTALCFLPFVDPQTFVEIFLIDAVVHYHIDWAKMNINRSMGWGPTTHEEFWMLTGMDQFMHQACYIFLVWYAFT